LSRAIFFTSSACAFSLAALAAAEVSAAFLSGLVNATGSKGFCSLCLGIVLLR
jgi:hypothetical protein